MSVEAATNGHAGTAARTDDLQGDLLAELRGGWESLVAVAELEWQRLRLRAVDALLKLVLFGALVVAGLAAAAAAGVAVVLGVRDGLAQWSGALWVGEVGAGLVVLVALALGGVALRSVVRRRLLAAAVRPKDAAARSERA